MMWPRSCAVSLLRSPFSYVGWPVSLWHPPVGLPSSVTLCLCSATLVEWGGGRRKRKGAGRRENMIIIGTEDTLHKSVLSFYHVGSRNGTKKTSLAASSSAPEPSISSPRAT